MWSRRIAAVGSFCLVLTSLFFLALLGVGGCGKSRKAESTQQSGSNSAENSSHKSRKRQRKPLLKDWSKPAVAILLSGDQSGYFEPCGCSAENQLGGLSHRADLLRILQKKGWTVTALDLGGAVKSTRRQGQIKLAAIQKAFRKLGYGALALGFKELLLAKDTEFFLQTRPNHLDKEGTTKSPYVGANIDVDGFGPREFTILNVNGKTIAVTAIIGSKQRKTLRRKPPADRPELFDPIKRLQRIVPKMKQQKPDLMILLSYANREESTAIADAVPKFDVILSSSGVEDGQPAIKVGKKQRTLLLDVGRKGKHVGVLGFYPDSAKNRLRFELVELDGQRFGDNKSMHNLMAEYQKTLEDEAENFFLKDTRYIANADRKYAGVAQCKNCHKDSYDKWKTTKHAHAYESIAKGRRPEQIKNWIPRTHDPECLACHVTGWAAEKILRFGSGFLPKKLAGQQGRPTLFTNLKNQQCENCHGPGERHVTFERAFQADPSIAKIRESARKERSLMHRDVKLAKERGTCLKCHDLDNSPNFNFDKYWEKIEH